MLERVALYKLTSAFLRAYANLANEMADAGYSDAEARLYKITRRSANIRVSVL